MVNIRINNKELSVSKDLTILQAASLADIQIPRFCYHEKLTIAGNCRMCLVEMAKVNKPVASCALPVSEGMQVYTNSILVKKAREGVLELLLANHPLDCPICDQGGECDLQEQAMIFGNDRSRFYEIKRAVSDKTISPFIKTIMTRCIHCTRCVRFLSEVAGVNELGMTGRGSSSEIGTYIENSISSELSGNIIDLCPVGALTSKPYAFTARPWELRSIETIDILDAMGTNIKVDIRGPNLMRILPKINEEVNEEWITDKTRFSFDGYKAQRLSTPLFGQNLNYKYKIGNIIISESSKIFLVVTWDQAFLIFTEFSSLYNKDSKNIILGNQVNLESIHLLKVLSRNFNNMYNQYQFLNYDRTNELSNNTSNFDFPSNYSLNISPKDIEKTDVCLLVGTNLRLENPLLNSRLRKAFLSNNASIASIGPTINSSYKVQKLGNSYSTLLKICEGRHNYNSLLLSAQNPLILFGSSSILSSTKLSDFIINKFVKSSINNNKNKNFKIGFVNHSIGQKIQNECAISNFFFENNSSKSFNLLVQADELKFSSSTFVDKNKSNFNVYLGFQADRSAIISDLILPSASPLEEISTYFDINGSIVQTATCLPAPIGSRTSWKILLALLTYSKISIEYIKDNIFMSEVKNKKYFKSLVDSNIYNKLKFPKIVSSNIITNYYKTNSVTRNSRIMSQMVKQKSMEIRF